MAAKEIKNSFIFYLFISVLSGVISLFLITPLMTKFLSIHELGLVALTVSFASLVPAFSDPGSAYVLNSIFYKTFFKRREFVINDIFIISLLIHILIGCVISIVFFFYFILILNEASSILPFILILFSFILNFSYPISIQELVLSKNNTGYLKIQFFQIVINAVVLCYLLVNNFGIYAVGLSSIASALFTLGYTFFSYRLNHSFSINFKTNLTIIKSHGLPSVLMSGFDAASNNFDRLIVDNFYGVSKVAVYSHSVNYKTFLFFLNKALSRTIGPKLLNAFSNNLNVPLDVLSFNHIWYCGLLVITVFCKFCLYYFIDLTSNGLYIEAVDFVILWIYLVFIQSYSLPFIFFLQVKNQTKILTKFHIFFSILILVTLFFISRYVLLKYFILFFLLGKVLWVVSLRIYLIPKLRKDYFFIKNDVLFIFYSLIYLFIYFVF